MPLGCGVSIVNDFRAITCECCGGEGRDLRSDGGPDDIDNGECFACEGTGTALIEVEPIEMEDIDHA